MAPLIERNREAIVALCKRYGITRLDVFGSAARGTDFDEATSDADFFYDIDVSRATLVDDYFGFLESMEALLGRSVDLIDIEQIARKPYFVEATQADRTVLFAA